MALLLVGALREIVGKGSKMSRNELVDIAGELVEPFQTEKAWRFYDGNVTVWLPKSQVEWDASDRNPNSGTMTIPTWLATEKELI